MWKLGADTLNTSSFSQGFEMLARCGSLKRQMLMFSIDFNTNTMMKIVIFIVHVIVLDGSVVV